MKFTPRSKDDLVRDGLLPKGWYDFEVMSAADKVSKAGNEMIEVKLRVFDSDGKREQHVFDYLMEKVPEKLFDFCESVGLGPKYAAGTLTADDCVGKAAKVKIAIDDKNQDYPPKNVAKGYASATSLTKSSTPAPTKPEEDDEIPF